MTIPIITCEQFADELPDFLERDVDERTRARLEAHAVACRECGRLLADLRKLAGDAAALPELAPSRDLWAGIEARIETPVVEIGPSGAGGGAVERWNGGTQKRRLTPIWLGLAAAGLVALTATITHQITKRTVVVAPSTPSTLTAGVVVNAPAIPDSNATTDSVPPFHLSTVAPKTAAVSYKTPAEKAYDAEIARLRAVIEQRRTLLDSATVAVIERNLKVIDDAIAQCRDALRKDPASQFLIESLDDALDTKIKLLRTAATLPTRM